MSAETVMVVANQLRDSLGHAFRGVPSPVPVTPWLTAIEEDHNDPPGDTANYPGRALAFTVEVDGFQIRVLVEDVTPDYDRPE